MNLATLTVRKEIHMFPTTVDAIKAILRADPTVTMDERAWILSVVRSHGRKVRNDRDQKLVRRVMSATEVASRFGKTKAFVQLLAKQGILHKVFIPGHARACGYYSEEVERLLTPPQVPAELTE